jgi:hypothetical protein
MNWKGFHLPARAFACLSHDKTGDDKPTREEGPCV